MIQVRRSQATPWKRPENNEAKGRSLDEARKKAKSKAAAARRCEERCYVASTVRSDLEINRAAPQCRSTGADKF